MSNWRKFWCFLHGQKQPSRGVPRKRYSEYMQQIFRRTPMPKFDFNKSSQQLYWNHTSAWVFSSNLLHVFRKPFTNNNSKRLLLHGIIFNLVENQNAFSLFQSFLVYAILCHRINVFNSFCFFIIRQKTKAK